MSSGPMSSGPMSSGPMLSGLKWRGPFLRGQELWADSFCGRWISSGPILWAQLFCGPLSSGRPPVLTHRSGCAEHAHRATPLESESTEGSGHCRPFRVIGFDLHQKSGVMRFSTTQNYDFKMNEK